MGWFSKKPVVTPDPQNPRAYEPAPRASLPEGVLEAAFAQRRYGLLVRGDETLRSDPAWARMQAQAAQKIDELFALVPEGVTSLALHVNAEPGRQERDVETGAYLLGRCAVTNQEFQGFVDAGAYEDSELWPEEVWPHLIKFRDQTGTPGPRYWRGGRHDRRLAQHPVVGICWYEAAVYANWAGFRLPNEAEWQVAASWQLGAAVAAPRRYPWGDALDLECCNIWSSGHHHTLPVDACPSGAAPNGLLQLVGNVWEWVDGDFDCVDDDEREIIGEAPLKSIRGGAFDTYFSWQAISTFRSGLPGLARVHNAGFRCAMDLVGTDEHWRGLNMAATATSLNVSCAICGANNPTRQSLCHVCAAPLDLARSAAEQGTSPCLVTVLGDTNVGKTVYLGFLLDMLAQRTEDFEALPRDARSVDLPQTVISHMAWRMFPPKTPMEANQWHWSCYSVTRRGRTGQPIELITPDLPGEAIAAEVAAPETFKIVPELLHRSGGLLLLVDAALAAHGSAQPDFFALKMLSYIDAANTNKRNRQIQTPIAIVLTKADYVPECFDDPDQFARANLNRLWNMCERRCAHVRFFASSVVGALGFATSGGDEPVRPVPLHTALRGVLEPFQWLVSQL